jgi:glycosyltransferase involved in cell wall biosynthesis
MPEGDTRFGVVAIGRNEGDRLRRCLESTLRDAGRVVYVDSGSTDGSLEMARGLGATVVELDMSVPFTAARARNEGFRRLRELVPELDYVQFVDGDCEFVSGWLGKAKSFLDERADVAVVCGRRRERYPERSVYNMLCDIEWDTPVGQAKACGGDAMMRSTAFEEVGGFRPDLIAGEEPELCVRLRMAGWKIWRLGEEMTLHDAAMLRFGQWWKRSTRAGFAFAEGAYLHGMRPERHWVQESRSAWVWGLGLPLVALAAAWVWPMLGVLALAVYPLQVVRLVAKGERNSARENRWRALFLVLGKFPEVWGQLRFFLRRATGGQGRLIEYK